MQTPPESRSSTAGFNPQKFRRKSTFRDYLIYAALLLVLASVGGGVLYYYTRPNAEKKQLKARGATMLKEVGADQEMKPANLKSDPKVDEILGEKPAADPKIPTAVEVTEQPQKPVASSAYAGGRAKQVVRSDNPKLPPAGAEFFKFVEELKVNGVFPGNPAKVILNGRVYHAGDEIKAELGVTLVSVIPTTGYLVFRDKSGAELLLSY